MIVSYISIIILLILLGIIGKVIADTIEFNYFYEAFGVILAFVSFTAAFLFGIYAGFGGGFGFNKYTEVTTSNFTKAITTDKNSVVIVYDGKATVWPQYSVVTHFDYITNIIICERRSVLGNLIESNIKIVTP